MDQSRKHLGVVSPSVLSEIIDRYATRPDPMAQRAVRFPLHGCSAVVRDADSGEELANIDIVDLGFKGIGFITPKPIAVGTFITIELTNPDVPAQAWPCEVVRLDTLEDGTLRIGALFNRSDRKSA